MCTCIYKEITWTSGRSDLLVLSLQWASQTYKTKPWGEVQCSCGGRMDDNTILVLAVIIRAKQHDEAFSINLVLLIVALTPQ